MPGLVTTARSGMDIEQFPLLKALQTRRDSLVRLLAILNPALEAGKIPNPDFQTAKYELAQIVDAFENKISTDHMQAGKWETVPRELRALELTRSEVRCTVPAR